VESSWITTRLDKSTLAIILLSSSKKNPTDWGFGSVVEKLSDLITGSSFVEVHSTVFFANEEHFVSSWSFGIRTRKRGYQVVFLENFGSNLLWSGRIRHGVAGLIFGLLSYKNSRSHI
jgi:hypothetical protein